jgi:hypothetical protein
MCVCVWERERGGAEKGTSRGGAWDFQYDPKKCFRTKSPFSKPKQSIGTHELRWPAFYVSKASPRTHTNLFPRRSWSLFLHASVLWMKKAPEGFITLALRLPAQNLRESGYLNLNVKTNRKLDWSVTRTKDILHGVLFWMA